MTQSKNYYYFISSPFHLFLAANLALKNKGGSNIAVLNPEVNVRNSIYGKVLEKENSIFSKVVSFEVAEKTGKYAERKRRFKLLQNLVDEVSADRIYTGNDRRVEFQFTIAAAKRRNPNLIGIYLDEGVVTYLGHKSMGSIQHKYIDPFLKKLAYGWWWKNPLTIGSSDWVDEVHAAFPKLVHPLLKNKKVYPVDHELFKSNEFKNLTHCLTSFYPVDINLVKQFKVVIILTHESFYKQGYQHIQNLIEKVRENFPDGQIAIKAHPRSHCTKQLEQDFSDIYQLNHKVGMEVILPELNPQCHIIGDVSSVLFTTRWLRPELKVTAIELEDKKRQGVLKKLQQLYTDIDIPMVELSQLGQYLK